MKPWMRSQPMLVFFLIYWIGVFAPALIIGSTVSALVLHDRTVTSSVVILSLISTTVATGATSRERARRRQVKAS